MFTIRDRTGNDLDCAKRLSIYLQSYFQLIPFSASTLLCYNLLFMIRNKNKFLLNSELYHIENGQDTNFHQPSVNLHKYEKGVYCLGVRVNDKLPTYLYKNRV
jgi:hypothetical protein